MASSERPEAPPDPPAERRPGIQLGQLFGVPLRLSPSWFLLAAVVTLIYGNAVAGRRPELAGLAAYAVGFGFVVSLAVSVLLHELGHALTYRWHGIGVRSITLDIYGGFTEPEREARRPLVDAVVSLAGPAVSGVLGVIGILLIGAVPKTSVAWELVFMFAVSNVIVAVFNALPGLPLDGGRALRALVWAASGDAHLGSRVAGWIGRAVAVGLVAVTALGWASGMIGLFGLVFSAMIAMMLWSGASHAIRVAVLEARLRTVSVRQLTRPAVQVPRQTPLAEALRRAEESAPGADAAIVVVDTADQPVAVVQEESARAVPDERRPWIQVENVARTLGPSSTMPVDLSGEAVRDAVRANPATEYLVVSGDEIVGVLRYADLAKHLMS